MIKSIDPRQARRFRFVRHRYAAGVAELAYAFDDSPELIERITFPVAPTVPVGGAAALDAALEWLHLIAGVSYYKAGVPPEIMIDGAAPDAAGSAFLDTLYRDGLGEFAYRNGLDLTDRIHFPHDATRVAQPTASTLPARTLVPIGGGKDSLVSVEMLKAAGVDATAVWVGNSELIASCAALTGLPTLNIGRELAPELFDMNRAGALNGHIPVTAINSAILAVAAVLYGFNAIAFSNERSASSATLEYAGRSVNHQWSKGWAFEQAFRARLHATVATDLDYYSLLRPLSELGVAARFARESRYDEVFSSCNRNFRILGPHPADRWCGHCPKCHFVFLALAPFVPKLRLVGIFGRNLLDDEAQVAGFDALMEYHDHKPFECVGEASEARAAMAALATRAEWAEDAIVKRFRREILPTLDAATLILAPWLTPDGPNAVPAALLPYLDADR